MKQPTAAQILQQLNEAGVYPDSLHKSKGQYVARWQFFYTHGQSAAGKAEEVQRAMPEAQIGDAYDNWQPWPRDSYFEVRFTLKAQVA